MKVVRAVVATSGRADRILGDAHIRDRSRIPTAKVNTATYARSDIAMIDRDTYAALGV
jgi:hypothetical protein